MSTNFTTHDLSKDNFAWIDYVLFLLMIGSSLLIGIYFGCFNNKQITAKEYLLGGKTMRVFPIAMSLISSTISGVTLIAVPNDVYRFGATYGISLISLVVVGIISAYVYLPVFHKLQLTSTNEYLNIRFGSKIRTISSVILIISVLTYNAVVIYIPALVFSQATGIALHLIIPVICIVCVFYTTIGGLKAVVWADTLQTVIIFGAIVIIFFIGITSVGGVEQIFHKSYESQRLNMFDFDPDPTRRESFWIILIGTTVYSLYYCSLKQDSVQRFLAVPTINAARKSIFIYTAGLIFVNFISVCMGLIMYSKYFNCDPLSSGLVNRPDQIFPYYITDVARSVPGLSGLFIASTFSAALSTLSTALNALAATIYEDFLRPNMSINISEKRSGNILKLIVAVVGIFSTGLVFVVEQMGGLLPFIMSINGITTGPLLGIFTLGMLVPFANAKGALYGIICSLLFIGWLAFGAQWYIFKGIIKYQTKPFSVEGCNFTINPIIQNLGNDFANQDQPFMLYRISFYYYSVIGAVMVLLIGIPVSWFTRKEIKPVDADLLSPIINYFSSKVASYQNSRIHYTSVDNALQMTINCNEREQKNNVE